MSIRPTVHLKNTLEHLDISVLLGMGIRLIVLDLDNTLIRPDYGYMTEPVRQWLRRAQSAGLQGMILTNNTDIAYLDSLSGDLAEFQMQLIHSAHKPNTSPLLQVMSDRNLSPEQVCVIGDRILTDVLLAQRASTRSVLVSPLIGREERLLYRILRRLERLVSLLPIT